MTVSKVKVSSEWAAVERAELIKAIQTEILAVVRDKRDVQAALVDGWPYDKATCFQISNLQQLIEIAACRPAAFLENNREKYSQYIV